MSARLQSLANLSQRLQHVSIGTKCMPQSWHSDCLSFNSSISNRKETPSDIPNINNHLVSSVGHMKEVFCPTSVLSIKKVVVPTNDKVIEYTCPSIDGTVFERLLPPLEQKTEISTPPSIQRPKMEAVVQRTVQYWRHKKMKKHQLRVHRWKQSSVINAHKNYKKNKQIVEDEKEFQKIRDKAEEFDAEAYVRNMLEDARQGGYKVNIFKHWKQ